MGLLFPGAVIRRERLRRSWSQEGLCRGICVVSYLSKIEQGKTEASPEVLRLLFERLGVPWYDDRATLDAAEALAERCYEAVLACDEPACAALRAEFAGFEARMAASPHAPDAALLHGLLSRPQAPADPVFEPFFDRRRLALQRMLQDRDEEAMRLYPCALFALTAGIRAYGQGENYAAALGQLSDACDMAAREGYVRILMLARLYMGSCYCNQADIESMNAQYRVAERIAGALGDAEVLHTIRYNTASACLETGRFDEAYRFFSAVEEPTVMELHKLAVCCEKLGRTAEALAALDRAEGKESVYPDTALAHAMCALVRYRLSHPDYLGHPAYGDALLQVFGECRRTLPIGYAAFHLPWVLEWHTASRQYRAAYELLRDFPIKLPLK
ncbi:MAG: helix-turn-helix transcriptional regulator [Clostridiaceae bacterium]|nr:helix-turn-helix transcriptional regulator [Clostridiaceae bacterium]